MLMALKTEQRIYVYDAMAHKAEQRWRSFLVVPYDAAFQPQCKNGLHQFACAAIRCSCGAISITQET